MNLFGAECTSIARAVSAGAHQHVKGSCVAKITTVSAGTCFHQPNPQHNRTPCLKGCSLCSLYSPALEGAAVRGKHSGRAGRLQGLVSMSLNPMRSFESQVSLTDLGKNK